MNATETARMLPFEWRARFGRPRVEDNKMVVTGSPRDGSEALLMLVARLQRVVDRWLPKMRCSWRRTVTRDAVALAKYRGETPSRRLPLVALAASDLAELESTHESHIRANAVRDLGAAMHDAGILDSAASLVSGLRHAIDDAKLEDVHAMKGAVASSEILPLLFEHLTSIDERRVIAATNQAIVDRACGIRNLLVVGEQLIEAEKRSREDARSMGGERAWAIFFLQHAAFVFTSPAGKLVGRLIETMRGAAQRAESGAVLDLTRRPLGGEDERIVAEKARKRRKSPTGDMAAAPPAADVMSPEARALAALVMHPDWTNVRIAKHVGCSREHLSRSEKFRAAREAQRSARNGFATGESPRYRGGRRRVRLPSIDKSDVVD